MLDIEVVAHTRNKTGIIKSQDLNFINVLRTAFTLADPKSVKKTVKLSIFFTLLGSASVKAVLRTLMKLTQDLNLDTTFKVKMLISLTLNE